MHKQWSDVLDEANYRNYFLTITHVHLSYRRHREVGYVIYNVIVT